MFYKYKKIISLLTAICISLGVVQPVFAEGDVSEIKDDILSGYTTVNEEEVATPLTEEEQAALDYINNNPIMSFTDDAEEVSLASVDSGVELASTEDEFAVGAVNSVYNVLNNNNDYVSQTTGALTYEKKLLSLPGASGLDLEIGLRYNSQEAVITKNEFSDETEGVRKINFNSFAAGWSFAFPTIIKGNAEKTYGWRYRDTCLSFPDGSGYIVEYDYDDSDSDETLTLKDYKLSDMTLVRKGDTKDYELTYFDGRVYVFDGEYGSIKKISDRYGNEINFSYTEIDYYRGSFVDYLFTPSYYNAKLNALTEIRDSAGRVITLDYKMKTTIQGNEIDCIKMFFDNEVYSVIYLESKNTVNGMAYYISGIDDAEGYRTSFVYDDKTVNIYTPLSGISDGYFVNGNVLALEEVKLPTGGSIYYEYEKYRRIYAGYGTDWYEVYKISKISDTSGFSRTYEYENDYSESSYSNDTSSDACRYRCIMREWDLVTIASFDNDNNKISEYVYNSQDVQNEYFVGKGISRWQILYAGYVYHFDFRNESYHAANSGKLVMYRTDLYNRKTKILSSPDDEIPSDAVIKSVGNTIYIIYAEGDGTTESPYRLAVKEYNTSKGEWSEAESYRFGDNDTDKYVLGNVYYSGGCLFVGAECNNTEYMAVYDINAAKGSKWQYSIKTSMVYSMKCIGNIGQKLYFAHNNFIYEYDTVNRTYCYRSISQYSDNEKYGGYIIGDRMFTFDYYNIYEIDYENSRRIGLYQYAFSSIMSQYTQGFDKDCLYIRDYTVQKSADGNVYYIMRNPDSDGKYNIYRFDPGAEGDFFVYVGSRLFRKQQANIFAGGTSSHPELCFVSDGIEKIKLYEPATEQSTSCTNYTYNSCNQPTEVKRTRINGTQKADGGSESYTYVDKKSVIQSYTDILGNTTSYEYTNFQYYIPTRITKYQGTEDELITNNTLSADGKNIVTSETGHSDVCLKVEYGYEDENYPGNITSEKVYEKDDSGEYSLVSHTDYSYYPENGLVNTATKRNILTNNAEFEKEALTDATERYSYDVLGRVYIYTDPLGRSTEYRYNKNGWQTEILNNDGSTTEFIYQLEGANGGENAITTVYNETYEVTDYFNDLGMQTKRCENPVGGNKQLLYEYEYDGHNIISTQTSIPGYTEYVYDAANRVVRINKYDGEHSFETYTDIIYNDFSNSRTVDNSGKESTLFYDNAGRIIKEETQTAAGLAVVENFYDRMGNVSRSISPNGEETLYEYNSRGLLESVQDPAGGVVSYTYDALSNPLTVTNNGQIIKTNTYDNAGRVLSTTDAMGMSERYQYDNGGRVIKSVDRNGVITNNTYKWGSDYLERQIKGEEVTEYTYDYFGNMLTASNSEGVYEYSYTFNNLLQSVKAPDGKEISYSYDSNHKLASVNDYSGDVIDYDYDALERLRKVNRNSVSVAEYEYEPSGEVKSITYPGQGKSVFTYDNASRLISQVNTLANGTALNSYSYEYDLNGNRIRKTDNNNITEYSYDALSRLTSVEEADGTATSYTFDTQGNIGTKTVVHPEEYEFTFTQSGQAYTLDNIATHEFTYAYDKNNRLKFEGEYIGGSGDNYAGFLEITKYNEYDNNGNLLKSEKGGQIDESVVLYGYNAYNRLTSYTDEGGSTTSYTYTPDGLRSSKTQNGETTKFYWDRGYISTESKNSTITAKNYIGISGIFAREANNATDYMLKNGHGDVTTLVRNGAVTRTYDYDAYGVQKNIDPTDTNPFRYCGEYFDKESGSIYLRSRYYAPNVGRFISEDTHWNSSNMIYGDKVYKDGEIKVPDINAIMQSDNLYGYCMNNPVGYVDLSGEIPAAVVLALYAYAQSVITSPDLQYDMQMLAYDIERGDYLSAAFDLVDILSPGISGTKSIPKFIGKYLDEVADWLKSLGMRKLYRGSLKHNLTQLIGAAPEWMENAQAHHIFPVAHEDWFISKGIRIHNPIYGTWVEAHMHQSWSHEYNLKWEIFKEKNPNATITQILDYGRELADIYGFAIHY